MWRGSERLESKPGQPLNVKVTYCKYSKSLSIFVDASYDYGKTYYISWKESGSSEWNRDISTTTSIEDIDVDDYTSLKIGKKYKFRVRVRVGKNGKYSDYAYSSYVELVSTSTPSTTPDSTSNSTDTTTPSQTFQHRLI